MDGTYGNIFPTRNAALPPSNQIPNNNAYKVNVSRQKTKKWANFKPGNYDGDDWGADDDDDDFDEPQAPPPPLSYGSRTNSLPSIANTQQFSNAGPPSHPIRVQTQPFGPGHGYGASNASHTASPKYSPFPKTTASPPPPQSAGPVPTGRFPPRKSSMGQQDAPNMADMSWKPRSSSRPPAADSPNKPWTEQQSASPGSVKSPISPGKPLPFVRPADIYRRLEEEKDKERRSLDSGRPSVDSVNRGHERIDVVGVDQGRRGSASEEAEDANNFKSPRQPTLPPVAERKSEYGLEGLIASYGSDEEHRPPSVSGSPAPHQPPTRTAPAVPVQQAHTGMEDELRRLSTSPKLPDLARMSGFGEDLFATPASFSVEPSRLATIPDRAQSTSPAHNATPPAKPASTGEETPAPASVQQSSHPPVSPAPQQAASTMQIEEPKSVGHNPVQAFESATVSDATARPLNESPRSGSPSNKPQDLVRPPSHNMHANAGQPNQDPSQQQTSAAETPREATPKPENKHLQRPSIPGGWVSETLTTASDSPTPTPTEAPRELTTTSTGPADAFTGADSDESASNSAKIGESKPQVTDGTSDANEPSAAKQPASVSSHPASPSVLTPLRTPSPASNTNPQMPSALTVPKEQDRNASSSTVKDTSEMDVTSPVPTTATATRSDIPPTAPLNPQRAAQGSGHPDSFFVPLPPSYDGSSTLDTTTSSPLKESDLLRDEIIKSLSPTGPSSGGFLEADKRASHAAPGMSRESSYLQDVYSDYWADTDDKGEENKLVSDAKSLTSPVEPPKDVSPPPLSIPRATSSVADKIAGAEAKTGGVPDLRRRFSWEAASEEKPADATPPDQPVVEAVEQKSLITPATPATESPAPLAITDGRHLLPSVRSDAAAQESNEARSGGISHQVSEASTIPPRMLDAPIEPPSPISVLSEKMGAANIDSRRFSVADEKVLSPSPPLDQHPANAAPPQQPVQAPFTPAVATPTTPARREPINIMSFRQIMEMPSAVDRLKHYNETRTQFASIDTGLDEWLTAMRSKHSEHANANSSFKSTISQMNASNYALAQGTSDGQLQEGDSPQQQHFQNMPMPPGYNPSQHSGFGHVSTAQVGAKSKELFMAAGKAGKGFLSKGKNKLRGTGDKDSSEYSPPLPIPGYRGQPRSPRSPRRSTPKDHFLLPSISRAATYDLLKLNHNSARAAKVKSEHRRISWLGIGNRRSSRSDLLVAAAAAHSQQPQQGQDQQVHNLHNLHPPGSAQSYLQQGPLSAPFAAGDGGAPSPASLQLLPGRIPLNSSRLSLPLPLLPKSQFQPAASSPVRSSFFFKHRRNTTCSSIDPADIEDDLSRARRESLLLVSPVSDTFSAHQLPPQHHHQQQQPQGPQLAADEHLSSRLQHLGEEQKDPRPSSAPAPPVAEPVLTQGASAIALQGDCSNLATPGPGEEAQAALLNSFSSHLLPHSPVHDKAAAAKGERDSHHPPPNDNKDQFLNVKVEEIIGKDGSDDIELAPPVPPKSPSVMPKPATTETVIATATAVPLRNISGVPTPIDQSRSQQGQVQSIPASSMATYAQNHVAHLQQHSQPQATGNNNFPQPQQQLQYQQGYLGQHAQAHHPSQLQGQYLQFPQQQHQQQQQQQQQPQQQYLLQQDSNAGGDPNAPPLRHPSFIGLPPIRRTSTFASSLLLSDNSSVDTANSAHQQQGHAQTPPPGAQQTPNTSNPNNNNTNNSMAMAQGNQSQQMHHMQMQQGGQQGHHFAVPGPGPQDPNGQQFQNVYRPTQASMQMQQPGVQNFQVQGQQAFPSVVGNQGPSGFQQQPHQQGGFAQQQPQIPSGGGGFAPVQQQQGGGFAGGHQQGQPGSASPPIQMMNGPSPGPHMGGGFSGAPQFAMVNGRPVLVPVPGSPPAVQGFFPQNGWQVQESRLSEPLQPTGRHRHSNSNASATQQTFYGFDKETGVPNTSGLNSPGKGGSQQPGAAQGQGHQRQPSNISGNGGKAPQQAPPPGAGLDRVDTDQSDLPAPPGVVPGAEEGGQRARRNSGIFSSLRGRFGGSGADASSLGVSQVTGDAVSDTSVATEDTGAGGHQHPNLQQQQKKRSPLFGGLRNASDNSGVPGSKESIIAHSPGTPHGERTGPSPSGAASPFTPPDKKKTGFFTKPGQAMRTDTGVSNVGGEVLPPASHSAAGHPGPKKRLSALKDILKSGGSSSHARHQQGQQQQGNQSLAPPPSQRPPGTAHSFSQKPAFPHLTQPDSGSSTEQPPPPTASSMVSALSSRPMTSGQQQPSAQQHLQQPIADPDKGRKPTGGLFGMFKHKNQAPAPGPENPQNKANPAHWPPGGPVFNPALNPNWPGPTAGGGRGVPGQPEQPGYQQQGIQVPIGPDGRLAMHPGQLGGPSQQAPGQQQGQPGQFLQVGGGAPGQTQGQQQQSPQRPQGHMRQASQSSAISGQSQQGQQQRFGQPQGQQQQTLLGTSSPQSQPQPQSQQQPAPQQNQEPVSANDTVPSAGPGSPISQSSQPSRLSAGNEQQNRLQQNPSPLSVRQPGLPGGNPLTQNQFGQQQQQPQQQQPNQMLRKPVQSAAASGSQLNPNNVPGGSGAGLEGPGGAPGPVRGQRSASVSQNGPGAQQQQRPFGQPGMGQNPAALQGQPVPSGQRLVSQQQLQQQPAPGLGFPGAQQGMPGPPGPQQGPTGPGPQQQQAQQQGANGYSQNPMTVATPQKEKEQSTISKLFKGSKPTSSGPPAEKQEKEKKVLWGFKRKQVNTGDSPQPSPQPQQGGFQPRPSMQSLQSQQSNVPTQQQGQQQQGQPAPHTQYQHQRHGASPVSAGVSPDGQGERPRTGLRQPGQQMPPPKNVMGPQPGGSSPGPVQQQQPQQQRPQVTRTESAPQQPGQPQIQQERPQPTTAVSQPAVMGRPRAPSSAAASGQQQQQQQKQKQKQSAGPSVEQTYEQVPIPQGYGYVQSNGQVVQMSTPYWVDGVLFFNGAPVQSMSGQTPGGFHGQPGQPMPGQVVYQQPFGTPSPPLNGIPVQGQMMVPQQQRQPGGPVPVTQPGFVNQQPQPQQVQQARGPSPPQQRSIENSPRPSNLTTTTGVATPGGLSPISMPSESNLNNLVLQQQQQQPPQNAQRPPNSVVPTPVSINTNVTPPPQQLQHVASGAGGALSPQVYPLPHSTFSPINPAAANLPNPPLPPQGQAQAQGQQHIGFQQQQFMQQQHMHQLQQHHQQGFPQQQQENAPGRFALLPGQLPPGGVPQRQPSAVSQLSLQQTPPPQGYTVSPPPPQPQQNIIGPDHRAVSPEPMVMVPPAGGARAPGGSNGQNNVMVSGGMVLPVAGDSRAVSPEPPASRAFTPPPPIQTAQQPQQETQPVVDATVITPTQQQPQQRVDDGNIYDATPRQSVQKQPSQQLSSESQSPRDELHNKYSGIPSQAVGLGLSGQGQQQPQQQQEHVVIQVEPQQQTTSSSLPSVSLPPAQDQQQDSPPVIEAVPVIVTDSSASNTNGETKPAVPAVQSDDSNITATTTNTTNGTSQLSPASASASSSASSNTTPSQSPPPPPAPAQATAANAPTPQAIISRTITPSGNTDRDIFEEAKRKQMLKDLEEKIPVFPTEPDMNLMGGGLKKPEEEMPQMSATSYPGQEWNPYGDWTEGDDD